MAQEILARARIKGMHCAACSSRIERILRGRDGVTRADVNLAAEIKADPKIGTARRGALPLMVGGDFIGAFAVSGAPGGDKDEACVKAALDKIGGRLK